RAWHYKYASGARFDAEGLYIDGARLVLVAKTFDGREAELYALPLEEKAHLLKPVVLERVGSLPGFAEPATGAALAAGGLRLAVCAHQTARVYGRDSRDSNRWNLLAAVRIEADNVEAITWDGEDLILASEDRGLYRWPAAGWRPGGRP